MRTMERQNIYKNLTDLEFPETPAAAVISSVLMDSQGENFFSDNATGATIVNTGGKTAVFWQIESNGFARWKDITEINANNGIKKFIFIGKPADVQNKMYQAYIIGDHINVSGRNPLIGSNDDTLGARFPDMTDLYNKDLSIRLKECCKNADIKTGEATLLIPKDLKRRTELEQKIIQLRDDIIISQDVFAGAIIAKHRSLRSAGLFLTEAVTERQKSLLLDNILEMF